MLTTYASMINPEILKNKYVQNLFLNNVKPENNENDKLLLIKSLIAGVLKILQVPDEKIEAKITTISKEDCLRIMRILIKYHKTTSHLIVLQELKDFKIEGLDVGKIYPGMGMLVTDFLAKHIQLSGRR